jgi:hypothetical protein
MYRVLHIPHTWKEGSHECKLAPDRRGDLVGWLRQRPLARGARVGGSKVLALSQGVGFKRLYPVICANWFHWNHGGERGVVRLRGRPKAKTLPKFPTIQID